MRNNKVIIACGNRGRGKTDFAKLILDASPLRKKLIVDTFDSDPWQNMKTWNHPEWKHRNIPVVHPTKLELLQNKKGIYRTFSSDVKQMQYLIDQHIKNTFVLYEDATKYVGSRLTDEMRTFVYDTKQKNVDLMFIFHSLASVPPELVRVADMLTLFKTGDSLRKIETKYDNPDVAKLFEHVQKQESRYYNATINLN